jgi:hypothetical protein
VTLDRYRKLLSQVGVGQPALPNDNFDTSEGPGKYRLNHETHDALAKQNCGASPELRAEFLELYGERSGSA